MWWSVLLFISVSVTPTRSLAFTIQPQLGMTERYNDNILNLPGGHTKDFETAVLPSLRIEERGSRFSAAGEYVLDAAFYAHRSDLNTLSHKGDIEISTKNPLWTAKMNAEILSTTTAQMTAAVNGGIQIPASRFLQERAGGKLQRQWTRLLTGSLEYSYVNSRYQSTSLVDSESHSIALSASYGVGPNDRLSFSGGEDLFRFNQSGQKKSDSATNGWVQWSRQEGPLTELRVGTGMGVHSGSFFWLADVGVHRQFKGGTIEGTYQRNFGTGGGLSGSATLTQTVSTAVSKELLKNLMASAAGNYTNASLRGNGPESTIRSWSASGGLSYPVLRWLNGSLSFTHSVQRSGGLLAGVTRSNQALVSLSTRFTPWIFL